MKIGEVKRERRAERMSLRPVREHQSQSGERSDKNLGNKDSQQKQSQREMKRQNREITVG